MLSGGNSRACREKFGKAVARPPPSLSSIKVEEAAERWTGLYLDIHLSSADDGDDNSKELCALADSLWLENGSCSLMGDGYPMAVWRGGGFCQCSTWQQLEDNTLFLLPFPSSPLLLLSLSPSFPLSLPSLPHSFLSTLYAGLNVSAFPPFNTRRQHNSYTHFIDGAIKRWPWGGVMEDAMSWDGGHVGNMCHGWTLILFPTSAARLKSTP